MRGIIGVLLDESPSSSPVLSGFPACVPWTTAIHGKGFPSRRAGIAPAAEPLALGYDPHHRTEDGDNPVVIPVERYGFGH